MSMVSAASAMTRPAADVCKDAGLSDDAQALLAKKPTVTQFLAALSEKALLSDACKTLAFALPKREAIWWASQCVRAANAAGGATGSAALQTAERWTSNPDDKLRREAHAAAESAGIATPSGCVALAVFFSGGSLGPAEFAEVPPGETLTSKAVSGAVTLAAVIADPAKADEKLKKFIALGQDVVSGKSKWTVK